MEIKFANSNEEIARCHFVMAQLRPHLDQSDFVSAVQRQRQEGYRLIYVEDDGQVQAVAGFRILEMLAHGRFLYVDDLVTDARERSLGYGATLLDWLAGYARSENCSQLHLDSGVHRADAHRFYFRQRMHIAAYHFAVKLDAELDD